MKITSIIGFLLALPTMYLAWDQYERFMELSEENAVLAEMVEAIETIEENQEEEDGKSITALLTLIYKKKLKFFGE